MGYDYLSLPLAFLLRYARTVSHWWLVELNLRYTDGFLTCRFIRWRGAVWIHVQLPYSHGTHEKFSQTPHNTKNANIANSVSVVPFKIEKIKKVCKLEIYCLLPTDI